MTYTCFCFENMQNFNSPSSRAFFSNIFFMTISRKNCFPIRNCERAINLYTGITLANISLEIIDKTLDFHTQHRKFEKLMFSKFYFELEIPLNRFVSVLLANICTIRIEYLNHCIEDVTWYLCVYLICFIFYNE